MRNNADIDDKSSSASSDSGCESEIVNGCHGSRNDCCHGNTNTNTVECNNSNGNECVNGIKPTTDSKVCVEELRVIPDTGLDQQSNCSDMSIADTVDGNIVLPNGQEQSMGRQLRPRRKYYMYGNLKLIKPIKDVPKRFLDLLGSMSAEKHRVEGEPIILAAPPTGGNQYQEVTTAYTFNPDAQCFVPGTASAGVDSNSAESVGSSVQSTSATPSTSQPNYTMYVYHSSLPHASGNPSNNHHSNSIVTSNHSNPQFPCTPLYTGFHSNQQGWNFAVQ